MIARLNVFCALASCGAEVSVLLIELRDHHHARHKKFIRVSPCLFCLHLDTFDSVDHDEGAVSHAQSRARVGNKCGVAGGINEIKFCIAVLEMCESGIECDLAGDGIFFVIGDCGAFVDLSPAWCGSGDVEKRAYRAASSLRRHVQ